jgi:hypothetical protein
MTYFHTTIPKVVGAIQFSVNDKSNNRKESWTQSFQLDDRIPRNIMDEIKALIGDGNAKVTVGADFGISDYGTGAKASAFVTLTCGQDTASIERAASIAGDLARDIAQEQRQRAENELQTILAARQPANQGPRY